MKNHPLLCLPFVATAAILSYRICKADAATDKITQASDDNDKFVGVTGQIGASAADELVDLNVAGVVPVTYGGAVAFGDPLTSDANGKAVVAGDGDRVLGTAMEKGALDEIGSVLINHAQLAPPAA